MTICDNCIHRNVCADEGHYDEALSFCADKIEEKPHGEWIEGTQGHYCSECDAVDQFYFEHDFCPKCGADMRGGRE